MVENTPSLTPSCGIVAVIGAPNAGKSTLVNALTGTKVSIVSPRVQTTRARVLGIALEGQSQIILIDTPGIFAPRQHHKLEGAMVRTATLAAQEADFILLMLDASDRKAIQHLEEALAQFPDPARFAGQKPLLLALNKTDKIKPEQLLPLSQTLQEKLSPQHIFMISALSGDGLNSLRQKLAEMMPKGPWLYDADQVTDMPDRLLAAEITREKLFLSLREELPYALTVETEAWEVFDNGSLKISQIITVGRDGHKGIVLGKGGSQIKAIGVQAREDLEKIFETTIHLKLFVRVRENWMQDPAYHNLWGLDRSS